MSVTTNDSVARLWHLCNVLKDDGVTYHEYVTELTYLLFLKMADETGVDRRIATGCRWEDLERAAPERALTTYREILALLAASKDATVRQIYASARTSIKKSSTLVALIAGLDTIDWYHASREELGDIYEGLLAKNAGEKKSGAGQYFTPRPLIDCMVDLMKPTGADVIQDPAAGTGGFLVAADRYIRTHAPKRPNRARGCIVGMEHVLDTHRLALMNLMLHGLTTKAGVEGVQYGDTLSPAGQALPKATLILTNPPFGTKTGGGPPPRDDFAFRTSNKQLCFLQHIYGALKPGGRAAVVVPDNVLFDGNTSRLVRTELMNTCDLHTILRLPTGIFYAPGVKTNVLFFTRGKKRRDTTRAVWIYDLRTGMPAFGRRTELSRSYFADFERAYGEDPLGSGHRVDEGSEGRFRRFTREMISAQDDRLDTSWLDGASADSDALGEPRHIAEAAILELEQAIGDLRSIAAELG
jgi:type I restriction enzyme M protein